jgi:NarL family two-component system response regulator LiaR
MTEKIRLLIADDHKMVRDGLKAFIATQANLQVIAEARDGVEAVTLAIEMHPDVILLDLVMPNMDGIEATRAILKQDPEARILINTSFIEDEKIIIAIRAGAAGFILKDSTPQELSQAIQEVYQNRTALPPPIASKMAASSPLPENRPGFMLPLTESEIQIVKLVAQGMSTQEITDQIGLSEWIVSNTIKSILKQLNLENRIQIALFALREGLANPDP